MGKWAILGLMGLVGCGSVEHSTPERDAGPEPDAALVMHESDAGSDAGKAYLGGEAGSKSADESGSGGTPAESGGNGGKAGSESQPTAAGMGGAGRSSAGGAGSTAAPSGGAGAPSPTEHVLWSQAFSCGIHQKIATPGDSTMKFALTIDAGEDCQFGLLVGDLGKSDFATDGKCIVAFPQPQGAATLFDSTRPRAACGGVALDGFAAAISGHKVTKLHRSQTFTISIQGGIEGSPESWTEGDVSGTWEALGY